MKKGAVSPLYLHLACEELRSFAVFEKVRGLPDHMTHNSRGAVIGIVMMMLMMVMMCCR